MIRRVAEMKQILDAAEEYLEDDGEATDAESVVTQKSGTESELSSNYGKLKHSDSLLLLTQVRIFLVTFYATAPNLVRIKKQSRDSHIVSFLQSHPLSLANISEIWPLYNSQDSCIIVIRCNVHLLFLRKGKQIFPFLWRHFAKPPSLRQP